MPAALPILLLFILLLSSVPKTSSAIEIATTLTGTVSVDSVDSNTCDISTTWELITTNATNLPYLLYGSGTGYWFDTIYSSDWTPVSIENRTYPTTLWYWDLARDEGPDQWTHFLPMDAQYSPNVFYPFESFVLDFYVVTDQVFALELATSSRFFSVNVISENESAVPSRLIQLGDANGLNFTGPLWRFLDFQIEVDQRLEVKALGNTGADSARSASNNLAPLPKER
jgi:hypothetical protein